MVSKRFSVLHEGQWYDMSLVKIDDNDHWLREEAAVAFMDMRDAAYEAGIDLKVNTAFRDYAYQQRLYEDYVRSGMTGTPVARPGSSDHERGTAVDISVGSLGWTSPTYRWLAAHASQFGFRNTVSSEPWHWSFTRYVSPPTGPASGPGVGSWFPSFKTMLTAGALGYGLWWWYKSGRR